jgi:hypothetical protein
LDTKIRQYITDKLILVHFLWKNTTNKVKFTSHSEIVHPTKSEIMHAIILEGARIKHKNVEGMKRYID